MKESGFFLRSNFIIFRPPLNCHVPAAWLPNGRGRVTQNSREKQVTSFSQLAAIAIAIAIAIAVFLIFRPFNGGKSLCCSGLQQWN